MGTCVSLEFLEMAIIAVDEPDEEIDLKSVMMKKTTLLVAREMHLLYTKNILKTCEYTSMSNI